MRGDEAKAACPEIQLVQVPVARGKADLNLYRSAGSEVDGCGSLLFTCLDCVCVCLSNNILLKSSRVMCLSVGGFDSSTTW